MTRYARTPTDQLHELLSPGCFLSPLLSRHRDPNLHLDIQFREGDKVHVYRGLTRLIEVHVVHERIRLSAHKTYQSQPCGVDLFRDWSSQDPGFEEALNRYLSGVKVSSRHISREGEVQRLWGALTNPWTPFDREAVLGYTNKSDQTNGRCFPAVEAAREEVDQVGKSEGWAKIQRGKVAAELDQLAVDQNGCLVLIELKYAKASPASVYLSPLQLLQYAHEWAQAFPFIREDLQDLIKARVKIGISPPDMPNLDLGIRPIVGFGTDDRSPEVRARFEKVLSIANRHLPTGVSPIEAWALENGNQPVRIV